MQACKSTAKQGFALVEVLISAFLSALALAGILSLISWTGYATSLSSQKTQATTLTQKKMEQLLAAEYEDLSGGHEVSAPYSITWEILGSDLAGTSELNVKASWVDLRGQLQTITNRSYATETRIITDGMSFDAMMNGP
jgi:Tfp pilus assembly protein PilV